jgi:hypothetical protein
MLRFAQSGDAYARAGIKSDGTIYWGPGGATATGWDTNLYRSAADVLKTDDAFSAAGLTTTTYLIQKRVTLTEGASVSVNAALGNVFTLVTTSGSVRDIAAPSNPTVGQVIHFAILHNDSGTSNVTWNSAYHLAGSWTNPSTSNVRTISFVYLSGPAFSSAWYELSRSAANIP